MGCGVSSHNSKSHSSVLIRKLTPNFQRTQSNLTSSQTFSRQGSFKSKCLKLKLLPSSLKLLSRTLNLTNTQFAIRSFKYISAFKHIKETFLKFVSTSRYFYSQVHEVCFSNFDIEDGVFIMLVSMLANSDLSLKFNSNFPFFTVQGQMSSETAAIFSSWSEFIHELENISKKNCESLKNSTTKLQDFIQILHQGLESTIRPRKLNRALLNCENAISWSTSLIKECSQLHHQLLSFFSQISSRMKDLQYYAKKAKSLQYYSGERIVHCLLQA